MKSNSGFQEPAQSRHTQMEERAFEPKLSRGEWSVPLGAPLSVQDNNERWWGFTERTWLSLNFTHALRIEGETVPLAL